MCAYFTLFFSGLFAKKMFKQVLRFPNNFTKITCKSLRHTHTDMEPLVLTERVGKVFMITINRPEKRNCVNQATADQLCDAVEEFESYAELRVALLLGKGGNFCAGYDLAELSSTDAATAMPTADQLQHGRGPMGPSRRFIEKPIIAAVEGYAVAGGLELALMCDMRVVEESTIMGVYCRRFGVPLLDGGTVRLPALIGHSRASDLILTGRPVQGKEAWEMGLANRLTQTGAAVGVAMNIAQSLSNYPQECMNRDRKSAFNACFSATSFQAAIGYEWDNAKHVIQEEAVSGAQRFVGGEGRSGDFGPDSKL